MDFGSMFDTAKPIVIALALKVAGAIVLYIIGRWLIGLVGTLINKALERQKIEPTVVRYIGNTINVALNILLVIGILGYFGVETTSFAALIAALGIAIGAAWGGLLSNFAAGVFILVLRPFKVGDYVLAGEVEGTVRAIGLFTTAIDAPDNVNTMVGNAKVMNGTIKNFSNNPYRRVDLTAQLDHTVDVHDAIRRLKDVLPKIANVVPEPKPDVEVVTFTERGPVLAVRPYVHTNH
jgi:small conductance mechanosensitive channel